MYAKITKSGGRQYVQLVEGYRTETGKVRHRVVANLGRLEDLSPQKLDPPINGLNRVLGRTENTAFAVEVESAKAYGNVFALHELWKDLGFDRALSRALRSGRREIKAEALVRAMVNRPEFAGGVCVQMLRSFLIFVQAFIECFLCFLGRDVADGTVQSF